MEHKMPDTKTDVELKYRDELLSEIAKWFRNRPESHSVVLFYKWLRDGERLIREIDP